MTTCNPGITSTSLASVLTFSLFLWMFEGGNSPEIPDKTICFNDWFLGSDSGQICDFTIFSRLSISQRRCRFPHESNLKHNPIYTYTMCRMECRISLCLKYCNCIPHFYRRIGKFYLINMHTYLNKKILWCIFVLSVVPTIQILYFLYVMSLIESHQISIKQVQFQLFVTYWFTPKARRDDLL